MLFWRPEHEAGGSVSADLLAGGGGGITSPSLTEKMGCFTGKTLHFGGFCSYKVWGLWVVNGVV